MARDSFLHVGEDACSDSAEQRRAERRALLRRRALERQLEHGRDDPRARARCARRRRTRGRLGLHADRTEELERVPQAERHALEHGADERAAVVAEREAGEGRTRASGSTCGVRSPARYGQERQPLDTRRPRARPRRQPRREARRGQPPRAASRASRRRRASPPSRASRPGPRGRRNARARPGRRQTPAAPRRRLPMCRARPTEGRGGRLRLRARRPPGHLRPRPPEVRQRSGREPVDSSAAGSQSVGISSPSRTSPLQRRCRTSKSRVPEASATSVACSPASRSRT